MLLHKFEEAEKAGRVDKAIGARRKHTASKVCCVYAHLDVCGRIVDVPSVCLQTCLSSHSSLLLPFALTAAQSRRGLPERREQGSS
jgi:hypothetical protein